MVIDIPAFPTPSGFLRFLGRRPRVLALGEPTHGIEEFLLMRNEFFRDLVEREGYTAIALESSCVAGLVVDDYLRTGEGSLDEVMRTGFSHGFGESAANRALVEWMRGKGLRFFGCDAPTETMGSPSPRVSLLALHAYLQSRLGRVPHSAGTVEEFLGEEARWSNPEAAFDPAKSVGATEAAMRLRLIADELAALLVSELPALASTEPHGPQALWRARLHARTATGLLRFHAAMATPSPDRLTRLAAIRDSMMAENLLAVAEQHRTLFFAHNLHLQREPGRMRMGGQELVFWGAGAIAEATLGEDYVFIASALGAAPARNLEAPEPETLEGILSARVPPATIVSSRGLADALAHPPKARVVDDFRYFPFDPGQLGGTDGIVYVNGGAV